MSWTSRSCHSGSGAAEMKEAPFVVSADIKAAHRLVKVRKEDWGLLACRSDSSSTTVWLNTVGTFGVSSPPYWWCRLFACVGRYVGNLFHNQPLFQLVYVDDLLGTFIGVRKFLNLWIWLLAFELVGTPFGYHKFSGGFAANFVGYHIRYDLQQVGITAKWGEWLVNWIKAAADLKFVVQARDFREFLGRLGFVAQLLVWLKPHLAPLYAWGSAVAPGTVGKLPETIVLTLLYISLHLKRSSFLLSVKRPLVFSKEAFRTDAKCEDGRVVLGGWECANKPADAKWFHVEVKPDEAPFLFREEKSQWASTSAELLASLAALHAFGWLQVDNSRKYLSWTLTGGTDNLANQFLTAKRSTTRWPLMIINMQLSHCLSLASLSRWLPFPWNWIGGLVRRTPLLMESLTETSLPLMLHAVFLWSFLTYHKRSFGSCGKPRPSLIQWRRRRNFCKVKFLEDGNGKGMKTRRPGELVVSALLKMGWVCLTQAIWMAGFLWFSWIWIQHSLHKNAKL